MEAQQKLNQAPKRGYISQIESSPTPRFVEKAGCLSAIQKSEIDTQARVKAGRSIEPEKRPSDGIQSHNTGGRGAAQDG